MNVIHDILLDYSGISKEIRRTESACKQKLQLLLHCGIYKNEREILIAKLSSIQPDENIPMKMRLAQLCNTNCIPTKDFDRILEKGHCGVHVTHVPPQKLAKFSKEQFTSIKGNLDLSDDRDQLLNELNGKHCIMPDDIARKLHNLNPETGGVENPHIFDPEKEEFRDKIHEDVFVCTDFVYALRKYRNAADRFMYYGYDMERFGKTCYVYVFTAEDLRRSAFINVIARASLEQIENFAKSLLPVPPSGCFKVT